MTPPAPRRQGAAETATARLSRLLTMVPWLVNRQGIHLDDAAAGLGITTEQLEADLNLLFLCGYGTMPDELIDVQWQSGRVYVSNAETIARPLTLGVDEAITLMVGLRALLSVPGLEERGAAERALAKLEEATGAVAQAASRVAVTMGEDVREDLLTRLRAAVADRRRVHLRYLVPSRDETTERDVDPMRVVNLDGHWYLEGWCHRASDTRLFRLDRMERLVVLDIDGTPPAGARERDLAAGSYAPRPEDEVVTLLLRPGGEWVADYYPVESREDRDDGTVIVRLRTADRTWLRRLVWRLGGRGKVLDPSDLVDEVRYGATEALAAYGAAQPGEPAGGGSGAAARRPEA
jgi:proteasome accessory factor C